jgi:hypothetical protein
LLTKYDVIIYFNVFSTKPPSAIVLKYIASIPRLKSRFALPDDVGKKSINQLKGALKDAAKQVKERSAKSGRYSSHHSSTRQYAVSVSIVRDPDAMDTDEPSAFKDVISDANYKV